MIKILFCLWALTFHWPAWCSSPFHLYYLYWVFFLVVPVFFASIVYTGNCLSHNLLSCFLCFVFWTKAIFRSKIKAWFLSVHLCLCVSTFCSLTMRKVFTKRNEINLKCLIQRMSHESFCLTTADKGLARICVLVKLIPS